MELQVGVKILLKNEAGLYLVVHRNKKQYPNINNLWDIAGGRIDPGSTLIDNLKREVLEETGLIISGEPKIISAQDILRIEKLHVVRLTYLGHADGQIKLSHEHDFYKWISIEEIKALPELDIYLRAVLESNLLQ